MNYKKGEITVIIPCYKAGKYMQGLYEKLQAQTFKSFQVLLVNDGDKSQCEAMEAIAQKDSRINVIWKENGGASSARNVAIDLVKTEWIVFVDADDSFEPTYLQNLFNAVVDTDAEIGIGGYKQYYVKNERLLKRIINVKGIRNVMSYKEAHEYIIPYRINAYPWNKIYKTETVHKNNIYMDVNIGVIHDYVFNMQLYKLINNVSLIPDSGYIYYMEDSGSLVSSYDKNFEHDRRLVIQMEEETNRLAGWSEDKITNAKQNGLELFARLIILNLFKRNSNLTLKQIKDRIQNEVFEKTDIMDSLKRHGHRRGISLVTRFLILYTTPWFVTVCFKIMCDFRNKYSNVYAKFVQKNNLQ